MQNNFILTASRDENKNLIFTSAAGTVFNLAKLLDDHSIRKVKQAISFKQNVKITFEPATTLEEVELSGWSASATKSLLSKSKPFTELLVLSNDYQEPVAEVPAEQLEVLNFIHKESVGLKPNLLKMQPLSWKYLIRSAMRGKNIMMTGPAGCGKTMAAKSVVNALDRPEFYFNLGATQDPRTTLIGNTHFNKDKGTYFSESLFVTAIQTPNAVILLDELSRAHPDAWNILMTVLDQGQRYLRLDEKDGSDTIKVAEGVTFIATANIGNEYTSTRVMDKALLDRFIVIELAPLSAEDELDLLQNLYPDVAWAELTAIADIVGATRIEIKTENPRLSTAISTRASVEIASLIYDGFTLSEAAEVCVYPQYDDAGGVDSERTFIKQIIQKYCDDGTTEDLFNVEEEEA
jgi:MoxR-like ATPase|tara:strand:- start:49 stop:1266 length:1218 start_codon:yes stop_codon:yes gene_type:complete